ncbi:MAG: hypothetical protein A2509_01005 [Candidatus Edwardsbacteria bacterium RIFOXYD12_FULL_50_11]|uniref:Uncharacterized protein n=1 Tax=Candidatus Edwardsbacteria bacterium GWF2_54_11 TaxID=1817851 RepID=A0A1F5RCD1_9BACT|nr:MAG: hypothetical protein A2502_07475 [Candidatus Edwardsbacteria bacterium RifOxyC12_full_54_24]OGF07562.1 MAG: hypothetical protein A2273_03585 [Candidatus Edwardsbacteria bacterium RifOxyA12_full_54_48]OGF09812.1 MAG: hypothetical protein A3K15_09995 [Candidatus Edwardsbacteria bacterium GWE2_54_12]OGF12074.1 MAG: hypothetical protein A2024_03550 [Candidatus Edwardsbacteria bacterium GWF2_54_11]OGF16173.1 MAG: hypothetical protein A2509_01005 [Candidatus Edwardsbacteria bacterium RIFOXYD1
MKYTIIVFMIAILGLANNGKAEDAMGKADNLFYQGLFPEAEAYYNRILKKDSNNVYANLMLGQIALYGNRFSKAETHLKKALTDSSVRVKTIGLLSETYYRQDRFAEAGSLFAEAGQMAKADKLQAFKDRTPYLIESAAIVTELPFVQTDPLPLIMLTVNGRETMFLIDTGGWELSIDEELAKDLGIKFLGTQTATFAGGKTAATYHGILDSVKAGSFIVRNVPINISQAPKRAAQMFQQPVRGVVGTCFLYHFNFTLDYPGGKLVLARRNSGEATAVSISGGLPFWMAGDHIMVAWGTVNSGQPQLFFIDTGLAGGGFTATEATIKTAGIKLGEAKEGMGGGGEVQVRPFTVDRLTLGNIEERDVRGLFGALPPGFESRFGFLIGGIISHGFFRPYRLTFNFDSMKIFLEKKK